MLNLFSPGTVIDIDGAEYRPQGCVSGRINLTSNGISPFGDRHYADARAVREPLDDALESARSKREPNTQDEVRLLNKVTGPLGRAASAAAPN